MSTTAALLIQDMLLEIGAIAAGESLSASEQSAALRSLNRLIDSWSNESLMIPNRIREVFPLVANQQSYTMGSGANFDTTRPQMIENLLLQYLTDSPNVEIPIRILNKDEWASIIVKTITSDIPIYGYVEGTYPNETINLWPIPSAAYNLIIYSWKPLATLSSVNTDLSFPPGYERALIMNGAAEIAASYGKEVTPALAAKANESKANIERMNSKPLYLRTDNAFAPRVGAFNWRTGGSGNR